MRRLSAHWMGLSVACTLLAACAASTRPSPEVMAPPRLVVVIVADQMRADYLERYEDYFTGGLARLMDEGRWYRNAWVDHAYTNSLPGHISILTSAYPARHGVVDNVWHEWEGDGFIVKSGFTLVDRRDGRAYGLDAQTLPEWFAEAAEESRFAVVGSNDAPRLYAGQRRGPVLWFEAGAGGYRTNDNYAEALPDWAEAFNVGRLTELAQTPWESTIPPALAARLRPDDVAFEGRGAPTHFPHNQSGSVDTIRSTPLLDQATLELAARSVEALGLGDDSIPDVLAVSLDSLDTIGHAYGPFSHEQTDALLRLDRNLGDFFAALDAIVGEGRWTVALTADHGVATTPEQHRLWGGVEGQRVSSEQAREVVEAAYAAAAEHIDPAARARAAAQAVREFDFVRRAYTESEVAVFAPGFDSIEGLLALSYRPGRYPVHPFYFRELPLAELGVYVALEPEVMMDWGTAIHGSQWDYDRRVPLLFMGSGVAPGEVFERAATVDVAVSLAGLAGVAPQGEVDGRALPLRE